MGLLASCWFIIEYIIIPADDGSLKWFYLSFYIHPFFLFFCRIFLCLDWLQKRVLLILVFLYRITSFCLSSVILRFLRHCIKFLCSFNIFNDSNSTEVVNNDVAVEFEISEIKNVQNQVVLFRYDQGSVLHVHQERVFEVDDDYKVNGTILDYHVEEVEQNNMEDSSSFVCSSPSDDDLNMDVMSLSDSDLEMDMHLPSVCSSNSPAVIEQESIGQREEEEEEVVVVVVDIFYNNYTEKMRWFDVLILDRTCGISAILNKQFVGHGSIESIEPMDFSGQDISRGENNAAARKRLLRSLESDLEMVYVAQACLSWEALHYQYRKVEALSIFSSTNGVFYDNIAERFQKFQILLERFMENEWCDKGKRYWNYVQRRSSFKSLLQVPQVSGYVEEEREGIIKGEGMKAAVVLKAIEKCIKAFGLYVQTEHHLHKPWWKLSGLLRTNNYPPLEDPRDFNLLCELTNSLQKKKLWLKDLEGKKRSWLRGRSAVENALVECDEKKLERLFTTIDMKLVSRVLKMSLVSTSQLKWCQEKLNNIDFIQGKLMRASVCGPLFPS